MVLAQKQQEEIKVNQFQHNDELCPNIETIKQLKGQIKRLRQELILKGTSKRKTT